MARACLVCTHPKLKEINKELIQSKNISEMGRKYDLPDASLIRHRRYHLPKALVKSHAANEAVHGDNLLQEIRDLQARALDIYERAEKKNNLGIALNAISQMRLNIELLAKILVHVEQKELKAELRRMAPYRPPTDLSLLSDRELRTLKRLVSKLGTNEGEGEDQIVDADFIEG